MIDLPFYPTMISLLNLLPLSFDKLIWAKTENSGFLRQFKKYPDYIKVIYHQQEFIYFVWKDSVLGNLEHFRTGMHWESQFYCNKI